MCFSNVLEAKHSGWFGFVTTGGYVINNSLERNIRQRKVRCPEHKAAKEAEVDSARHLEQWVEGGYRIKPTEKARLAYAPPSPDHGKGIQERAIPNEIKNGVDPFP